MTFIIADDFFIRTMYFMEHEGPGFRLSSDEKEAKEYDSLKEANEACKTLEAITGWRCKVKALANSVLPLFTCRASP